MATNQDEAIVRLGFDGSDAVSGMKSAGDSINASGEHAADGLKLFNTHGREMHKLIHILDNAAPGLGSSLRLAFNPSTFGIAILVLGIEKLIEWFKELGKSAKEAFDERVRSIIEFRKIEEEANKSSLDAAGKFAKAMAESQQSINDAIKERYAYRAKILEAEISQHRKIIDLLEERALAEAKGDKSSEERIKKSFNRLKSEFDSKASVGQLAEKKMELEERRVAKPGLITAAKSAEHELELAKSDEEFIEAQKRLTTYTDAREKQLRKQVEDAKSFFPAEEGPWTPQMQANREDMEAGAKRALDDYLAAQNRDKEAIRNHAKYEEFLNEEVKSATDTFRENNKAIDDLTREVQIGAEVNRINRPKAAPQPPANNAQSQYMDYLNSHVPGWNTLSRIPYPKQPVQEKHAASAVDELKSLNDKMQELNKKFGGVE